MNQCFFCLDCCFCWHTAAFRGGLKPLRCRSRPSAHLRSAVFGSTPAIKRCQRCPIRAQVNRCYISLRAWAFLAVQQRISSVRWRRPKPVGVANRYRRLGLSCKSFAKKFSYHLHVSGFGISGEPSQPAEPGAHAGSGAGTDRQDRCGRVDFANMGDIRVDVDVQVGHQVNLVE
jgi:hypothetical protein